MAGRYFGENGGKNVYGGKKMMVNPYLHVVGIEAAKYNIKSSTLFQYLLRLQ